MRQTELKTSVSLPPCKTAALRDLEIFYLEIFYLLAPSHYPYIPFGHLMMLRHHYPFIPFRHLVRDETSSLPTNSMRTLFWQIEICSGVYT